MSEKIYKSGLTRIDLSKVSSVSGSEFELRESTTMRGGVIKTRGFRSTSIVITMDNLDTIEMTGDDAASSFLSAYDNYYEPSPLKALT